MTSQRPPEPVHGALLLPAVAMVAAAVVVAAVIPSLTPIFASSVALSLAAAVILPTAVALASLALETRSLPPVLGRPGARLIVDIIAVGLLIRLQPADASGHQALRDLLTGGARILTLSLPVPAAGPPLGVVIAAVGLATGIATELARRSTRRLAPITPGIVLLVAALLVGSGGATPARWAAPLVLVACGASVIVSGMRSDGSGIARAELPLGRLAAAGLTVVVIAAVIIPAGTHLPGAHARAPYVLRRAVAPPPQPQDQPDPLSGYAAIHDGPLARVFSVKAPGENLRGQYWQVAVLDTFNGADWTTSPVFRPAGSKLPIGPPLAVPTTRLRAQVTVYQPTSYLPAPDRAVSTSLPLVDVDQSTGVLAPVGQVRTPLTYRVTSVVAAPGQAALLDSSIPAGNDNAGAPPVPAELSSLAQDLIHQAQPTAWDHLLKLQSYLTGRPFTLQPPGHSTIGNGYSQVMTLIRTHSGSAEQYASAFAVLARAAGFHTRLAIGYLSGTAGADGDATYTTADYTVWPEVLLNGIGWEPIPVDPATGTGAGASSPAPPSPVAAAIARQRQIDQARAPTPAPAGRGPAVTIRATPSSGLPPAVIALLAVLAAAAASLLAVLALKSRRVSGQRRGVEPGQRLAGAWEHALDRLSEFGVPLSGALTAGEVAAQAVARLGPQRAAPAAGLVPIVDAARYDSRFPPTRAAADAAWVAAGNLDAALRTGTSLRRRARARLSLAPLRRH